MPTSKRGVNEVVPPLIKKPGEGHAHPGPFSNLVLKADSESTHGMYSLHEETLQPGDGGPPVHTHVDQEEAFYVLEGELTMVLGEGWFVLRLPGRGAATGFHRAAPRSGVPRPPAALPMLQASARRRAALRVRLMQSFAATRVSLPGRERQLSARHGECPSS